MQRIRRDKAWTVSEATLGDVRKAIVELLVDRAIRLTSESDSDVDGESGSAVRAALIWTDKTAPYRVHVSFRETDDARIQVEGAFEERPQMSKTGPMKTKKYSRLADEFFDGLHMCLANLGHLDADTAPDAPAIDTPGPPPGS